eukprot:gene27101-2326_t
MAGGSREAQQPGRGCGRLRVWRGRHWKLVKGDETAYSWLSKLELMKDFIVDRPKDMRPEVDELAACYAYASWINNGTLPTEESGDHDCPSHHANVALQMFQSLEWVISDALPLIGPGTRVEDRMAAEARVLAARRMHSRLPSIRGQFLQSTPLTRIRDIAQRDDISQGLKDEMKLTLENKLHRCAGPEDLVTAEQMLERITLKTGEFSDGFVNEFKKFNEELREFFNASGVTSMLTFYWSELPSSVLATTQCHQEKDGLTELLISAQASLDDQHSSVVALFLRAMAQVEAAGGNATMDELLNLLQTGTQARTYYVRGLSAGLRQDVTNDMLASRQKWRLADLRLEEFNCVVLSRLINSLEAQGGASMLSKSGNTDWAVPMAAVTTGLRNMGLGQFSPRELFALENELQACHLAVHYVVAWHCAGPFVEVRENALRGKASMERVLRVSNEYGDAVLKVYEDVADKLGTALGIPDHMSRVFGGGPESMDGVGQEGVVLLVKAAEGDEEVGPLAPKLQGVILQHQLAHLSHLGVRARRHKVTFASCDDVDYVESHVRPLVGKRVRLRVTHEGVVLREVEEVEGAQETHWAAAGQEASTSSWHSPLQRRVTPPAIKHLTAPKVLALGLAEASTCGFKAAKCAVLEREASKGKRLFKTPKGCCLPFGNMELAITAAHVGADYQSIVTELESSDNEDTNLDLSCASMQRLINSLPLDESLCEAISATFGPHSMVAVRSSANVEDLEGMSSAGLYASVVDVPAADARAVSEAVTSVWGSLFSRRAVLSRRAADNNPNILMAEAAPGQGETLSTPMRGTPWRFEFDKSCSKVDTRAFANFSRAWVRGELGVSPEGVVRRGVGGGEGVSEEGGGIGPGRKEQSLEGVQSQPSDEEAVRLGLVEVDVDYSKMRLSADPEHRDQVVRRMAKVGMGIEAIFERRPQDIEGGLVAVSRSDLEPGAAGGGRNELEVYAFQTRPQH